MESSNKVFLKKVIISGAIRAGAFFKYVSKEEKKKIINAATFMSGKRVVHVNATETGGGVAEISRSLVLYLRSLGVNCDWYCINQEINKKFFVITNKIHNALQGSSVKISKAEWKYYEGISKRMAADLDKIDCDILCINDPQLLLAGALSKFKENKIFFCHIDTSSPFKSVWRRIEGYINVYDQIVFSNRNFVGAGLNQKKIKIIVPAIDPLAEKQKIVSRKKAREYLKKSAGIPENLPLVAQISRFDVWKNPLGVIEAFRIVQQAYPELRLALVGFDSANDNPAAKVVYKDAAAVARNSREIYLFFSPKGMDVLKFTVMAQNGADIIVQNSTKEGFGLVVAEAMWKKKPVIGGPAYGIKKQIISGKNGFIVKTPEELAKKIIFLLKNPRINAKMGVAAQKSVREKFLFPRLVLDHLKLYNSV